MYGGRHGSPSSAPELTISSYSVDVRKVKVNPKSTNRTAIHSASSVRLAIVLYDRLIQDVSRADHALAHRRPEQCATEIGHALAVIGYLQATVCQNGASHKIRNSDRFYATLRESLMEAEVRSSRQILGRLEPQLMELREAWIDLVGGA
jgi:flagellin-specific chaperone FliS